MSITLDTKIEKLCQSTLGSLKMEKPLKRESGGRPLVRPKPRWCAKWRFLAYRFRKLISKPGHYILSQDEEEDLTEIAKRLANDIQQDKTILDHIETLYFYAVDYKNAKRLDLKAAKDKFPRGRFNPDRNRYLMIWDIVWGLAAITDWVVDFQGNLKIIKDSQGKLTLPTPGPPDEFFELIERRLRKLEHMRYHVPGAIPVINTHSYTDPAEVPEMLLFKYPSSPDDCIIGGENFDATTGNNVDWEPIPLRSCDFMLNTTNPVEAIKRIFNVPLVNDPLTSGRKKTDDSKKTRNYCDKVLQILHLEEVVEYLDRADRKDVSLTPNEVIIMTSWNPISNKIGTGIDEDFFERTEIRMDELIPGDHFILRNHPIYQAFVGEGAAWRLENAIVSRIRGQLIPGAVEVEGHGLGPYSFQNMQADLLSETRKAIKVAQDYIVKPSLLTEAFTSHEFEWPYTKWFDRNGYKGPLEFRNEIFKNDLYEEIKQDTQLSTEVKDKLKKRLSKLAFAGRCLLIPKAPSPPASCYPSDPFFAKKYLDEFYVDPGNPASRAQTINARVWELPFVSNLTVKVREQILVLEGSNLLEDRIRGVYFVSYPRYHVKKEASDWAVELSSNSQIAQLGKWVDSVTGSEIFEVIGRNNLRFLERGRKLEIDIPSNFLIQDAMWHPVLRVSLFDPTDPELKKYFPNDDLTDKPIEWFESQDETNKAMLKKLKDGIAALQLDIRAELAFYWPYNGPQVILKPGSYTDSNPPKDFTFPVEGHGFFNVVYFPLFRMCKVSGSNQDRISVSRVNLRLIKAFLAGQINRFFKEHAPEGPITVIRPKPVQ